MSRILVPLRPRWKCLIATALFCVWFPLQGPFVLLPSQDPTPDSFFHHVNREHSLAYFALYFAALAFGAWLGLSGYLHDRTWTHRLGLVFGCLHALCLAGWALILAAVAFDIASGR